MMGDVVVRRTTGDKLEEADDGEGRTMDWRAIVVASIGNRTSGCRVSTRCRVLVEATIGGRTGTMGSPWRTTLKVDQPWVVRHTHRGNRMSTIRKRPTDKRK